MGCNVCKCATTVQETESIGLEFASKYFEALTARPGAVGLDRFYDNRSMLVTLERGPRSVVVAQGVDEIERSVAEMNYHKCALNVDSVETEHVDPRWFCVLVKGEQVHFDERLPRAFLQSTIFKYTSSPLCRKRFRIVETILVFYDNIIYDNVFEPVPGANAILSTEGQRHLSPRRVEGPEGESADGAAKTPGAPLTLRELTTGHSCYGSKLTLDESIENDENQKKCLDAIAPAGEPRTPTETPTEVHRSIAPEHVPEESIENDIEYAKQLPVENITTNTPTELNTRKQNGTERKQFLTLKHALEELSKSNQSVEDTKRHVSPAISPNESREMRKILTEKQSAVLKHILQGSIIKPRVDNHEQATGGGLNTKRNSMEEKQCTECSKSSVGGPAARHGSVAGLPCAENIPKVSGQWKTRRNQSEPAASAMQRTREDQDETNVGSTEDSRAPVSNNLLYVGALSQKVKINDLYTCFGRFGKVISVDIFSPVKKEYASERQNCAIVRYENPETVEEVASNGTVLLDNGNVVIVKTSKKN